MCLNVQETDVKLKVMELIEFCHNIVCLGGATNAG